MKPLLALVVACLPLAAVADMNDEPLLFYFGADNLEWRTDSGADVIAWDIESWYGTTRDRVVVRSEGEVDEDETEEFDTVLAWSRGVTAFWNVNAGMRNDWQPGRQRNWAMVELEGTAPGYIETRVSALAGSGGRSSLRLKLATEWFLSQRWKLEPELESNWYSDDDLANGLASGVTDIELALRLKYIVRPNLTPYIGVNLVRQLGDTADLTRANGGSPRATQLLAGVAFWF